MQTTEDRMTTQAPTGANSVDVIYQLALNRLDAQIRQKNTIETKAQVIMGIGAAAATDGERVLERADLEQLFTEAVVKGAPWPAENLQVSGFSAIPPSTVIPAGELDYTLLNQLNEDYLGKKLVHMALLVDGIEVGRVRMSGDVALYEEVVVTTKNLGRHAVLKAEDVQLRRRNTGSAGVDSLHDIDEVVGKRLKTTLRAGELLYSHLLEEAPLVKQGDLVTIVAESPVVRVAVPGQVKSAGGRGETIKVKNLMSRREVFARVVDNETVAVDF